MDAEAERARGDRLAKQCETCLEMQRVCLDLLAAEKAESARLRGELGEAKHGLYSALEQNEKLLRRLMELEAAAAKVERAHPWPPPVNYGQVQAAGGFGPTPEQIAEGMV